MNQTDVLNYLAKARGYKTYLEIGTQDYEHNCAKIICETKHGVDPFPRNYTDYTMTSDDFFKQLDPESKYDLIFIDGLHLTEQVDRDIENSLAHLNEGGVIMIHDCRPTNELQQVREDHGGPWYGDVWKSIAKIRFTRKDLKINVVDVDTGCGILRPTKVEQPLLEPFELTWENYCIHKNEILNIITPEQFAQMVK